MEEQKVFGVVVVLALTGAFLMRPGQEAAPLVPAVVSAASQAEPEVPASSEAPEDPVGDPVADADVLALLASFLDADIDGLEVGPAFDAVRAAARRRQVDVDFVVATIPDWVDSNARWLSDGVLDAMQRAMAQSGYALDRFRFPDLEAGVLPARTADETGRRHELAPAVVLFREANWDPADEDPADQDAADSTDADPAGGDSTRDGSTGEAADCRPVDEATATADLVVLFLVAETATSGIHSRPFIAASRFVVRWERQERETAAGEDRDGGEPAPAGREAPGGSEDPVRDEGEAPPPLRLRVLGPTFSGSSPSLRMAVERLFELEDPDDLQVDIVSGSATWEGNKALLEGAGGCVSFRATVLPDIFARETLLRYVRNLLPHGDEAKIAILVESNTSYGIGLRDEPTDAGAQTAERSGGPTASSEGGRESTEAAHGHAAPSTPLTLPFPLHISRLRSDGSTERGRGLPGDPRVALDLEESGYANDRIPTLSPGTTLPHVELVLRNILDTVRRENVAAVGLYATDTRDKLFLAREVARRSPNVLLFTLESDLLYTHPEYGPYMRGTIVGSTYPLFNLSQVWTDPVIGVSGRQQFTSTNSHGVFNALLALVNYDRRGRPLSGADTPPLLDYRWPGHLACNPCRPAFWISVAARDGLWPVAVERFAPLDDPHRSSSHHGEAEGDGTVAVEPWPEKDYVFSWQPPRPARDSDLDAVDVLHPSMWAVGTFAVLSLVVFLHAIAFWGGWWRGWPPFAWFAPETAARTDPGHGAEEHQRYLLACFVALLIVSLALNVLFVIWLAYGGLAPWRPTLDFERVLALITLVVMTGVSLVGLVGTVAAVTVLSSAVGLPSTGRAGLAVILGAVFIAYQTYPSLHHIGNLVPYGQDLWLWLLLHFERATNPSNWISPTLPVLLVAAPLYLWSLLNLSRLSRPRLAVPEEEASSFAALCSTQMDVWGQLRGMLSNPYRGLPVSLLVAAVALVFLPKLVIGYEVVTFEGVLAGEVIDGGVFLVQYLIVLTLLQGAYTWDLTRRLLERLEHHPMVEAFGRIPNRVLVHPVSPRSPRLADLHLPLERARRLLVAVPVTPASGGAEGHAADAGDGDRLLTPESSRALRDRLPEVEATLGQESPEERVAWNATPAWATLRRVGRDLMPILQAWWTRPAELPSTWSDSDRTRLTQWHAEAEEVVAIGVVLATRDILRRVVRMLGFVVLAQALLLGTHVFFPFQQRQLNIGVDWAYLGIAIGTTLLIFSQMDRQPVLCRVSSEPGRTRWSRDFVGKIVLYGILPVLGLLAAYFPEVGGVVFQWVQRFQGPLL